MNKATEIFRHVCVTKEEFATAMDQASEEVTEKIKVLLPIMNALPTRDWVSEGLTKLELEAER